MKMEKPEAFKTAIPLDELFTLKRFIAWLEKYPRETTYLYTNIDDCLIVRYCRDNGYPNATGGTWRGVHVGGYENYEDYNGSEYRKIHTIVLYSGVSNTRNYGNALRYAKKVQRKEMMKRFFKVLWPFNRVNGEVK